MRGWIVFPYAGGAQSNFMEHITSLWTGGGWNGFGHVELWVDFGNGVLKRITATPSTGVMGPYVGPGWDSAKSKADAYSSQDRHGKPLLLGSPAYKFLKLPDDFDFDKLLAALQPELGCGYDWLGAARHALPFLKQSKNKWYCSELVAELLATDARFNFLKDKQYQYSPNRLYKDTKSWLKADFV